MAHYRNRIIELAHYWADPGSWKPTAEDLVHFFIHSGAEAAPTVKAAQEALNRGGTGVTLSGTTKHWCGIFACYVIRDAGLGGVKWTLLGGGMRGIQYVPGNKGMQPGDVAMIPSGNHHFIVTDVNYAKKRLSTVEGNTMGQYIRYRTDRSTTEPYGYYRIPE